MRFLDDGVIISVIGWGIMGSLLHIFFIENQWLFNCLAFCMNLKDNALEKLALRPWWLTALIAFQTIVWMIIMFMGMRLWLGEKNEKSS